MEHNLVEIWLRRDPIRWVAGILAGLLAGAVAMLVAMLLTSATHSFEPTFPMKLMGTIVMGASATEIGQTEGMWAGFIVIQMLCAFWGFVYAHFTGTNRLPALLPMGLVWGIFSWIFIWNLFLQSVRPIVAAHVPTAAALLICVTYGLSLSSVSIFDRLLRGKSSR
jgi:hypothetical protein